MTLMLARRGMKVGQLARRTGLSVRTLHYYDEIGLLSPTQHTESGHRLYSDSDIARLQQIMSLKQLGLSLEAIQECLDRPGFSPRQVIELHLAQVREQIEMQCRLRDRLEAVASGLRQTGQVSVEALIELIEEVKKMETQFTPEQMEKIKEQGRIYGEEHIRQVEQEWPQLIEKVRSEMDNGTDPSDERVQALARRWRELVNQFTGGDPGIEKVLRNRYQEDPTAGGRVDPRMLEYMEYINKAMEASNKSE